MKVGGYSCKNKSQIYSFLFSLSIQTRALCLISAFPCNQSMMLKEKMLDDGSLVEDFPHLPIYRSLTTSYSSKFQQLISACTGSCLLYRPRKDTFYMHKWIVLNIPFLGFLVHASIFCIKMYWFWVTKIVTLWLRLKYLVFHILWEDTIKTASWKKIRF